MISENIFTNFTSTDAQILDSGARRTFDTGCVRDIADGKGRCDLLALEEVGVLVSDEILEDIGKYVRTGVQAFIYRAMRTFIEAYYDDTYTALLELSLHYEAGAMKYSDRNWEKGMPLHCFVDSGVRHYLKSMRGDKDEPHDRAFLWNMLGLIWTHNNHPELIDLPFEKGSSNDER